MIRDLMVDEALLRVRQAVIVAAIEGKIQIAMRVTEADKEHLRDVDARLACAEQCTRTIQRFLTCRSREAAGEIEAMLPWCRCCCVKDLSLFGVGSGPYQEIYEHNLLKGLEDMLARQTAPEYCRDAIRIFWTPTRRADRKRVGANYASCMQEVYESIS